MYRLLPGRGLDLRTFQISPHRHRLVCRVFGPWLLQVQSSTGKNLVCPHLFRRPPGLHWSSFVLHPDSIASSGLGTLLRAGFPQERFGLRMERHLPARNHSAGPGLRSAPNLGQDDSRDQPIVAVFIAGRGRGMGSGFTAAVAMGQIERRPRLGLARHCLPSRAAGSSPLPAECCCRSGGLHARYYPLLNHHCRRLLGYRGIGPDPGVQYCLALVFQA